MFLRALMSYLLISCLTVPSGFAKSSLTDNIRISSKNLGYDLQYRVYLPDGMTPSHKLPTIYITDGQWYLIQGKFNEVLDREIAAGAIGPVIAIFIDNRNPDDLSEIRRNREFFCKKEYVEFYTKELVPEIDAQYPTQPDRTERVIMGVSFGGINAACFGLMAYPIFEGIAMQSPANDKHVGLMTTLYKEEEKRPLKIFMSVGTLNDNTAAGRRFKRTLVAKGYDVTYKETRQGHNWKNWRPLFDDLLRTFFGPQ
ncbi:alpha/beta hydrolase [Paremcibacter congregatus]|uniref:Esterase n=1 Tax=Paremcibacter congregatus TaxID=2043170 RepID=A0A2G4YMV6_9PROT|nr:alpha/beta hydrolase-fold protein [Paremcibacter congregatus]PHZ83635.1 hypothetical protein CRD36_14740 [Paremcibacter congregatus]QDE27338.1 esterase family protein [Paremcibacter congregatus]